MVIIDCSIFFVFGVIFVCIDMFFVFFYLFGIGYFDILEFNIKGGLLKLKLVLFVFIFFCVVVFGIFIRFFSDVGGFVVLNVFFLGVRLESVLDVVFEFGVGWFDCLLLGDVLDMLLLFGFIFGVLYFG